MVNSRVMVCSLVVWDRDRFFPVLLVLVNGAAIDRSAPVGHRGREVLGDERERATASRSSRARMTPRRGVAWREERAQWKAQEDGKSKGSSRVGPARVEGPTMSVSVSRQRQLTACSADGARSALG